MTLFTLLKNKTGRILSQQWAFGGICGEIHDVFMVIVPIRSTNILILIIENNIAACYIIISDCWKSYDTLKHNNAFQHIMLVNHKYNFVSPDSGAHTQNIERLW